MFNEEASFSDRADWRRCGVAAASPLAASAASAATSLINIITVTDSGRVNPLTTPGYAPAYNDLVGSGPVTLNVGQPGGSNPPAPNPGWDPWGAADTTHPWINIGNDNSGAIYNRSGDSLTIVWGSPNNLPPPSTAGDDNVVSFYTGPDGTGTLVGSVEANISTTPSTFSLLASTTRQTPDILSHSARRSRSEASSSIPPRARSSSPSLASPRPRPGR